VFALPDRRILSLWFPRLGAERLLRPDALLARRPPVGVEQIAHAQQVAPVCPQAAARRTLRGQPAPAATATLDALQHPGRAPAAAARAPHSGR